ncbi:MAG TPA: hypothetical protein EYP36_11480 [Calditrichaeota bacterium]|nr:hypothetical protein [Calditrichota bacterium]
MHLKLLITLLFGLLIILPVFSQDSTKIKDLEKRIKILEEKITREELQKLHEEAETAAREKKEEKKSKTFKGGQRSLQAINPEISITGDMYGLYIANADHFTEELRSGAHFRVIGMHLQSNLDPFSLAKVALGFTPRGFELGEAYMTLTRVLPSVSLTLGKFRQQFGVVNRWHAHSLDQFDFPLALTTILGEEGLNQVGLSFDWLMPTFLGNANSLVVQITNGQNEHLFSGEFFSFPAVLAHFKSYYDITQNTYLEFGLSGMYGRNDINGYINGEKYREPRRVTYVGGVDLTLFWQPVNKALYHSFIWRSELYYADKELPDNGRLTVYGGYSYIEYQLNEHWQVGFRLDYTQPFEVDNQDLYTYQLVPYITWWQSHWVKFRLQYNYLGGNTINRAENFARLQIVWAMGPHKHERY